MVLRWRRDAGLQSRIGTEMRDYRAALAQRCGITEPHWHRDAGLWSRTGAEKRLFIRKMTGGGILAVYSRCVRIQGGL